MEIERGAEVGLGYLLVLDRGCYVKPSFSALKRKVSRPVQAQASSPCTF
jgi:hypothetical protein